MAGTLHTDEYRRVVSAMTEARRRKGISQAKLAALLGRPGSFVAKVELCERRLDIIEFVVWVSALSEDPVEFLREHLPSMSANIPR